MSIKKAILLKAVPELVNLIQILIRVVLVLAMVIKGAMVIAQPIIAWLMAL